jgi:hypothetical protein
VRESTNWSLTNALPRNSLDEATNNHARELVFRDPSSWPPQDRWDSDASFRLVQ